MSIKDIIPVYQAAFQEFGDSPAGVCWPKGLQERRFHALTRHWHIRPISVLDFGCGLAHLKPFLDQKFPSVTYTGVDIVPEFIAHNAHKYPDSTFKLISSVEDIDGCFDHTAISGTFNIKYDESGTKNWDIISSILLSLFNKTHISLSADFFTDDVDYMQQDSYHQNPDKLYRFIRKHISKYMVMDSSYLPFEYAVTILKNIQE